MATKTDYARKCQQLDVLIDLLEKENKRLREMVVRCKDCKYAEYIDDVKTFWCTECGQGRTVAPYDFCSYGERRPI
jgi:hypothetical protein